MKRKNNRVISCSARLTKFILLAAVVQSGSLNAQEDPSARKSESEVLEEIQVTGTLLRGTGFDTANPMVVIDRSEMEELGVPNLTGLVRTLTFNGGIEFQQDLANQGSSAGSAQINLRNLGLNSTLMLLNGRRTTISGSQANDGSSFVDINQFPMIMLDRIEIVKDGASAQYGSDAVAGVANLITRQLDGLVFEAGYQTTTSGDVTSDTDIGIGFGGSTGNTDFNFFANYLDRTAQVDNPITQPLLIPVFFPGSYILLDSPTTGPAAGLPAGTPVPDPDCGALGGTNTGTFCLTDVVEAFGFQPEEKRIQVFADFQHSVSDNTNVFGEFSFSDNEAIVLQTQSILNPGDVVVPASHPNNPFTVPVTTLLIYTDEPFARPFVNQYQRYMLGANHEFENDWFAEVAAVRAYATNSDTQSFTVATIFQDFVDGVGGPTGDLLWNPFGSSRLDPAAANEEGIDSFFVFDRDIQQRKSNLTTYDLLFTGDSFELPAGPIQLGFGGQYRKQTFHEIQAPGQNPVFDPPTATSLPDEDYRGARDVFALFSEASIPIVENLELGLAIRHEDYSGLIGSSTDPKVSALWSPSDTLSIRGTWSSSFRAPSVTQSKSTGSESNTNLINPFSGTPGSCDGNIAVNTDIVSAGNEDLKPEDAESINAGFTFRPIESLRVDVDYWRYDYTDVIVQLDAQTILFDDCADDSVANSSRVDYGGDPTDFLTAISEVRAGFTNAAVVETDGIDLDVSYDFDFGSIGSMHLGLQGSWITSFDIQTSPSEPVIDGAGSRNKAVPFRALPEYRANFMTAFSRNNHSVNVVVRHIDGMSNDIFPDEPIGSQTTLDVQYSYLFDMGDSDKQFRISLGALNVTDKEPPPIVSEPFGFEARVHDARGRMVYAKLSVEL
jgi:outer membrane receptor protein involved in Fe transport